MKKTIYSCTIMAAVLVVSGLILLQGCQKESYIDKEFLCIQNIENKTTFTPDEKRIMKEANDRMSQYLTWEGDKLTLGNATAKKLSIDPGLYGYLYSIIDLYNKNAADKQIALPITKNPDFDAEPGVFENLADIAAGQVQSYMYSRGWNTSAKMFGMWYQGRDNPYHLNNSEWGAVSSHARQSVGSNFRNNPTNIGGHTYYQNQVSFYNAGSDLKYSYGTATVTFDSVGTPVGFRDTYDFNSMPLGERDITSEGLTRAIGILGNVGGNATPVTIVHGVAP